MSNEKLLHMVTFTLLLVGGLNWGLWALFNLDLVSLLFGAWPTVAKIVYVLIGLSAVYVAVNHQKDCKICGKK